MKNKLLLSIFLTILSVFPISGSFAQITFDNVPPLSGGGNTAGGVSFNFTTNQSITVQNLRCAFSTATGTATIWYNPQKINGAPNVSVANGWTSLGSATFAGLSPASTSPVVQTIPINLNLVMQPQDTFGFFIQWTGNVFPTTNTNIPTFTNGTVTIIADASSAFTGTGTTPSFNPRQINGGVVYILNAPCTAPPTAGTTVSSVSSVCPNTNFQLSLSGATVGTGLTYQWQSSPNGTTWNNITGATSSSLSTTQLTTTHYRAQVTCSGVTTNSTSTVVTTSAIPTAGTFTINKNAPASATNFTSFTDAIASIECGGVNGPVVFNVVANSGPYNEQVIVPFIPGVSATNTVTFNGNGNTISATPSGTNLGIITLNDTDFTTFDNLTLALPTGATSGWGVQLMNQADNNTISNCTINLPLTVTGTTVNGIVTGAAVATAANNANNCRFENNTINGGYYGIRVNGIANGAGAIGNQIINNTLRDNYIYNIYLFNAEGTLVEGNNISRPTRATVTTFYGITLGGTTKSSIISKNRIHNTHGGASSVTGAVYALYSTSNDAPLGSENVFSNNLIYNLNTNGTIYAIYNVGSDGAHYFHNTIDLSQATSTGAVRGFFQTTAATNIRFQNNIVSVNPGASGVKTALYFATTTSAIASNNNVLHTTGGASVGFWGTVAQATLAAWRTASSQDANSVAADPMYASPATGDFTPTNVAVNNIGMSVPVTHDINGLTRNPTSPDPGAYEFMNSPNDVGITAITSPNSVCGLTAQEVVTVVITNFGTMPQSNIPISYTLNSGTPVTATFAGPLNPGASATYSFTTTANLSASGGYTLVATTNLSTDTEASNDATTKLVANALIASLPASLDFETPAAGVAAFKTETRSRSNIFEDAGAAATGTKGMIMDGVGGGGWLLPVGQVDPWTENLEHFSAAYACFSPAGGSATDSLWLIFDLKQLFKTANANTNFRVTVNGAQVGPTYRPPFDPNNPLTPIVWRTIKVDLTAFKNLPNIEIGLESSVMEEYANATGTANLVDNVRIVRRIISGTKSDILAAQISVFPNPSAGLFNVTAPQGKYSIEVLDLTGRTILKKTATGTQTQLNLREAAKGIYMMKITSEGAVATKRLVVE